MAHVFFRGGSQGPFREELTRAKMDVLSNLDIWTQTSNSSDALLSAFYATKSVIKCLYMGRDRITVHFLAANVTR